MLRLTANEFELMSDSAIRDHFVAQNPFSIKDLNQAGIDATTPHLFRFFVDGELRYPTFQFTLDGHGRPAGIKLAIPLINAMNSARHDIDRDQDEAHRVYLLRYWLIPAAMLNGLSPYEALEDGSYTTRQIQEAILSMWVD